MERTITKSSFALVALLLLAGCSSGKGTPVVMPDVVGRQLDFALADIEQAGVDEEVDVKGGGTFGIVNKSNWKVCEQTPAAGKAVTAAPVLKVDRSCPGDEPAAASTTTAPPTTLPPTTAAPALPPTLNAANTPELAALLFAEPCSSTVADFAAKYPLATIEFNGSVNAIAPSDSNQTRFDIGVSPGDKGADSTRGPSFQFRDVATVGLLSGPNVPGSIVPGTKLGVVAQVQEYNPQSCLFVLKPVTVTAR